MATTYSYSADCELMTHYSSTQPHPEATDIAAVYDENNNPLVFGISKDTTPVLHMTIADVQTGINTVVNLSEIFGLTQSPTALTAFQDDERRIYLAFAVPVDPNNQTSNIYLCSGSVPAVWRQTASLATLLIPAAEVTQVDVTELRIVSTPKLQARFTDSSYPLLIVQGVVEPEAANSEIARIAVSPGKQWSLKRHEMNMTVAPTRLLDFAMGWTGVKVLSLMILFEDSDKNLNLVASHFNTGFPTGGSTTTTLTAPAGANKLTAIQNVTGFFDLLIAGNGLYFYSAKDLGTAGASVPAPTEIIPASDYFFQGVQDMVVCQSQNTIPIWVRTSAGNVCSATVVTGGSWPDTFVSLKTAAYPVYSGSVVKLSPMFYSDPNDTVTTTSQVHHFLCLMDDSLHYLLQYKPVNNVWDEALWVVPDLTSVSCQSITSYTLDITLFDVNNHPKPNTTVGITASDYTTIIANGASLNVGTVAQPVTTDDQGRILMVTPVDGIGSSSIFKISVDGTLVGDPLNPATNLQARLSSVKDGPSLSSQTYQSDGTPILQGLGISDSDANDAGQTIGQLHGQLSSVPADGSIQPDTTNTAMTMEISVTSLEDDAWAVWHWVEHTAKKVSHWVTDTTGKIVSFVVQIGEDAKTFLVNSCTRVLKALNYVLNQIKLEIEKIIDWLGFLFGWKDIERVQSDLISITKTVYGQISTWGQTGIAATDDAIDAIFDAINSMLANIDPLNPSSSKIHDSAVQGAGQQTSKPETIVPPDTTSQASQAKSHPGTNWATTRISNGSLLNGAYGSDSSNALSLAEIPQASQNLDFRPPHSKIQLRFVKFQSQSDIVAKDKPAALIVPGSDNLLSDFDKDVLEPVGSALEGVVETFASNIGSLVKTSTDKIGGQLIHDMIQFVQGILTVIKKLITGILNFAADFFTSLIDDAFNEALTIPFITTLVKTLTGVNLSLGKQLDITCLLIAMPTTVVGKLIDGSSFWPDISGFSGSMSALAFPTSWVDSVKRMSSTLSDVGTATLSAKQIPSAVEVHAGSPGWQNYSTACATAHSSAIALEYIESEVLALASNNGKNPAAELKSLRAISQLVACALSTPNEGDRTDDPTALPNVALDLEWAAWSVRAFETVVLLACNKMKKPDDFKARVSLAFMALESLVLISARAVRQTDINNKLSQKSDPNMATDQTIFNSIGMGFADVFAGFLAEGLRNASILASPDSPLRPLLLELGVVFGACDFGLDLGQGIYDRKQNLSYRASSF